MSWKGFQGDVEKFGRSTKKSEIETESRKSKLFLRHRTSWFLLPDCEKDVVRYIEGLLATSFFHFSPKALKLFLESSFSWPQAEAEARTQNLASVLGYDALSQKKQREKIGKDCTQSFFTKKTHKSFFWLMWTTFWSQTSSARHVMIMKVLAWQHSGP